MTNRSRLALSLGLVAGLLSAAHADGGVVYASPPPVYVSPYPHAPPPRGYYARPRVARTAGIPGTWYMGLGLVGTSIVNQSGGPEQLESGGGLSAWLGVRLNEMFGLEVGWLGSFHNPAPVATWWGPDTDYLVLEGVTADARLHLSGTPGPFDPYLQGGVGLYFLGSEHFGLDSTGAGFQAGGGFDVWLGPSVTLGLRALYHGIGMGPPEGGANDTFVSAVTFEGSAALHF